jgi:uncharacterized protein (DUF1330 family)
MMPVDSREEDALTAYMVVTCRVLDAERYQSEYAPQVIPLLRKYGIELLGAGLETTALEGDATSALIFRAETEAAFESFYNDPDNAAPIALRHSITDGRSMLVVPAFRPRD